MHKSILLILIVLGFLILSCQPEFEIISSWKNIPVVYGVLDPGKDTQYVRINKAFLGNKDSRLMARESDSLHYNDVEVNLENLNDPGNLITLYDTLLPKEKGIFAQDNNIIYATREKIHPGNEYKITINFPEYNKEITASTYIFGNLKFTNIFTSPFRKLSFSTGRNETLVWESTPSAKVYDIFIRFYYLEVNTKGDTIQLYADWKQSRKIAKDIIGGEKMSLIISGDDFYRFVSLKIKEDSLVTRLARKSCLDFNFTLGGSELYTYIQVHKPTEGVVQTRPEYSNMSDGLGLFSCRYHTGLYNKDITARSIDSLALGQYTNKLNFVDHYNKYYH